MEQAIDVYNEANVLKLDDVKTQIRLIHGLMKDVMKEGVHYGVIPGTGNKPTLYKAGAEKINFMFRLSATYECEIRDLSNGHREVIATCTLTHIPTGKVWGQGIGSCTTMEGKYRFRTGEVTLTDKPVPKDYWQDRDINLIGGKGHVTKKHPDTGKWMIAIAGAKVEHDNPADYFNTILKMAQKRGMVSADVGSTAASDIFTVDIEAMPEVIPGAKGKEEPIEAEVVDDDGLTEQEWMEEERKQNQADQGPEEQEDIPFGDRPFPGDKGKSADGKPKKISKAKGGLLYAKLKGVPGWGEDDREQFLKDIGVKSVYDVPEDTFENVKKLLDSSYKKK